jgi:hypothetical protein
MFFIRPTYYPTFYYFTFLVFFPCMEFAIMKSKPVMLRIVFSLSVFLFIHCTDTTQSPFTPDNSSISIVLESSNGICDTISISDTVECKVRIGITKYLPNYIDSTVIIIGKSASETDTVFRFKNMLSSPDTLWSEITFHSIGKRIVTATAYLKKGKLYIVSGEINIVGKPIQIITDPTSAIAKEDSSVFFTAKASGTPPFTYQWVKDGTAISNAYKDTLFISPVKLINAGRYVCLIKDQWGDSVASGPAVLTVEQKPAQNIKPVFVIDSPKVSYSIDAGQLLSFTIRATDLNNDSVSYLLKLSETTLPHKTGCTIAGQTVTWQSQLADSGNFFLVLGATDGIDQVYDTVAITVSKPTFNITVTTAGNGTVTPSGTQKIITGSDLSITGQPATGFGFSEWIVTGGLTLENPKDSSTKVLNVQSPGTVTAHFVKVYKITIQSEKRGSVTPAGDLYVKENQYLDISAACPGAFEFVKWSKVAGSVIIADSTLASTQIGPMTAAATVKARFKAKGMRWISKGNYGDSLGYPGTITYDFWIDTTEVTQGKWNKVTKTGDSTLFFPQATTWFQTVLFCNSTSKASGLDTVYSYQNKVGDSLVNIQCDWNKYGYRLPTEDEWEYTCRAGATTAYYWGPDEIPIDQYAWYKFSSLGAVHIVAQKKPNNWGLYDMAGNAEEWCWDSYDCLDYFRPIVRTDYRGSGTGDCRIVKGGSYSSMYDLLKSSSRNATGTYDSKGFRMIFKDPGE